MLQCRGMASAAFDLEEFVRNPSVAQFKAYHKAGLLELAEHYEVTVRTRACKAEIRTAVWDKLVQLEVFFPGC